mmetsp:Transcript_17348/g.37864  ORF Transcript_17348/g.37864 Transcript_17348/m.37864 type:complete len:501 (-) Transcript_17348:205-1707(-)
MQFQRLLLKQSGARLWSQSQRIVPSFPHSNYYLSQSNSRSSTTLQLQYRSMSTSDVPNLFCSVGSDRKAISDEQIRKHLSEFLNALGEKDEVLILPPDYTRLHSQAGKITRMICEHYNFIPSQDSPQGQGEETKQKGPEIEIMPALGTHAPMTQDEILKMFGEELAKKSSSFLPHDWRNDVVTIGEAPAEMVRKATHGVVDRPWPAQLNKKVWEKRQRPRSLVLSVGQVVPHEVMGMANFNKNLFVGTGGVKAINLSHFIGAVHGMENMMGRKSNPLRDILNYASENFLESQLDLWYILTVIAPDLSITGFYIGRDIECYSAACDLSMRVNFTVLDRPIKRCVAYMEPEEYHSTWVANKAIYRTRMAMADGGKLTIIAPGVSRFGEDDKVSALIEKYGYLGTERTMKSMEENPELQENLSAVSHLIHGSTEGRFDVTYCPGHLSEEQIEAVGFQYEDVNEVSQRYNVDQLMDGWHEDEEGEFYFISKPALGLWTVESRLR